MRDQFCDEGGREGSELLLIASFAVFASNRDAKDGGCVYAAALPMNVRSASDSSASLRATLG